MIGAFVVAGVVFGVGVFAILTQMGATRLSRAPNHTNRTQEES